MPKISAPSFDAPSFSGAVQLRPAARRQARHPQGPGPEEKPKDGPCSVPQEERDAAAKAANDVFSTTRTPRSPRRPRDARDDGTRRRTVPGSADLPARRGRGICLRGFGAGFVSSGTRVKRTLTLYEQDPEA